MPSRSPLHEVAIEQTRNFKLHITNPSQCQRETGDLAFSVVKETSLYNVACPATGQRFKAQLTLTAD
jgi:hypothetical protein